LAAALTPEGMRARLEETRALLLAPGAADVEATIARDPLRLAQIPFETRAELAAGVAAASGDPFVADEGRARLVIAVPRGNAFESRAAGAFVDDVGGVFADVRARGPGGRLALTGGHAGARATGGVPKTALARAG